MPIQDFAPVKDVEVYVKIVVYENFKELFLCERAIFTSNGWELLDSQYNILENVDIFLFTAPEYDDKAISYGFVTNRMLDRNGAEIPAKSPMGMFEESWIPNDLALVSQKIDEYYA